MKHKIVFIICVIYILICIVLSIFANFITPYSYLYQNTDGAFLSPSFSHIFGTDNLGRDIFSRAIYAIRNSLFLNIVSVTIVFTLFISISFLRFVLNSKLFDNTLEFVFNVLLSVPTTVFLFLLTSSLGQHFASLIICFIIVFLSALYRNMNDIYSQCINYNYVLAEQVLGMKRWKIFCIHIFYDLLIPLITQYSFYLTRSMLTESTLSFLGFGIQKPIPSLGSLIADTKVYIMLYPQQAILASSILFALVYSINTLGDLISNYMNKIKY